MGRDFYINGDTLLKVRGGCHMSGGPIGELSELGLASDEVRITPTFFHTPKPTDSFGPDVPPELLTNLAEVQISCNLIHFDNDVLEMCLRESLGGAGAFGTMVPTGTPMGGNKLRFASGWHYISLNLTSPALGKPWRFLSTYMNQNPAVIPIGNNASIVQVNFRAIPYAPPHNLATNAGEGLYVSRPLSSGRVLWDRTADSVDVFPVQGEGWLPAPAVVG